MSTSSRTRSSIRLWLLGFAGASVLAASCYSPAPSRLYLFVSGDSRGYLEPCGCRANQAGGLPGRARLISSAEPGERIVVDVGNITSGTRKYDLLKLKYMLEGMKIIGYDAVNLGQKEASMDLDMLRSTLSSSTLPFVSANVLSKSDKKPVTEQFRIIEKLGARIGVIGVTHCDPQDVGPGVEVRPAMEALADVIPQVRPKCDFLIVLAFENEEEMKDIANKFHEVDCVLGGDVPQSSSSIERVNRAAVFSVTDRGKVVGEIFLERKNKTYQAGQVSAVKIAADKQAPPKEIGDLLASFKNELRDKRFELASADDLESIQGQESTADEFVGSEACISCHKDAHKTWGASGHSRAYETLVKVKSEYDPECLKCHTVGYGRSSGFIDATRTPKLEGVQCENCHGRGKDHSATKLKTSLTPVTASTCIKCHDTENSENFVYATFWPKIKH